MNGITNWMEKHFVPIAAKIGSEKHLVALRDAFIALMPVTMAGSIAVLLNAFVRDIPNKYWPDLGIAKFFSPLISVNGNVWWGCVAMLGLAFAFSLGYHLAKTYDVNPVAGGLVSFAGLIATTTQSASLAVETITLASGEIVELGESVTLGAWGNLNVNFTNANGLFTAMIMGFLCTLIFIWFTKKKIVIKMPDGVPPAVTNSFAAIIPGAAAIFAAGLIGYLVPTFTSWASLNGMISDILQKPFLSLSQGLPAVIITVLAVQLFWFFGLHGTNILGPAMSAIYGTALNSNMAAAEVGDKLPFMWTGASFDGYAWMGGAGCTFALIIALLIFSKKPEDKAIAKLSLPMGTFNINEPITFGLPIVLNVVYMIPYILIPTLLVTIGYLATSWGIAGVFYVGVPWVIPPVLYTFLGTGGDIGATLVSAGCLALGIFLWSIFVRVANKVDVE